MPLTKLQYRILELSHKHGLTHLGSNISVLPLLDYVYSFRNRQTEPVCMGAGHAGLALYVILEKYLGINPEMMLEKHGIHATMDLSNGVYVSSGSLGQVETVAAGFALSNRNRRVWLISTDGGSVEGAFWETLQLKAREKLDNLCWLVNANGYAAYHLSDTDKLEESIHSWDKRVEVWRTDFDEIPFLKGLNAHYYKMTESDWEWVKSQEVV